MFIGFFVIWLIWLYAYISTKKKIFLLILFLTIVANLYLCIESGYTIEGIIGYFKTLYNKIRL